MISLALLSVAALLGPQAPAGSQGNPGAPGELPFFSTGTALLEQADRMQRTFYSPGRPGTRRPSWEPPVDVFETTTELWVLVALPGVASARLRVKLSGNRLLVSGERQLPEAFRTAIVHRLEIPHGRFERLVELPPGDYELTQRELVDGCLFLNLAKIA